MISEPDRVLIRSAQLAANDFPPVCAMTGAPAERWHKFTFTTALSRRASGRLPLTHRSSRRITLGTWVPAGLILFALALWLIALVVSSSSGSGAPKVIPFLYTTWVADSKVAGGPQPGYRPALTGLTGDDISSASASIDPSGSGWVVNITLTPRGANLFASVTRANVAGCAINADGSACAGRYLTAWLGLTQADIGRWEDPAFVAEVGQPADFACLAKATGNTVCPKLVVDALTEEEIDGGMILMNEPSQQSANDLANAIKPSVVASDTGLGLAGLLFAAGLIALIAGVVCWLLIGRSSGPRGKVLSRQPGQHDQLVELRNVHRAFVAAVNEMHSALGGYDASPPAPPAPPSPR